MRASSHDTFFTEQKPYLEDDEYDAMVGDDTALRRSVFANDTSLMQKKRKKKKVTHPKI